MNTAALDNRKLLVKLSIIAAGMFGFGFALVPFYERICEATGINNLIKADPAGNTQVDYSRSVTVEFDANTHDMPWRFRPLQSSIQVHPGQLLTVMYEVVNLRDHPVAGQAIPSYGPQRAARYIKKMECFCFTRQTLASGEKREMPVTLVVDSDLPSDLGTITLSYTFFEIEGAVNASAGATEIRGGKS